MEEAELRYPGAVELTQGEQTGRRTLEGRSPTYLVWVFGVQDDAQTVEQWYEEELERRGWGTGGSVFSSRSQYDQSVRTWERGGRAIRLSMLKTDGVFAARDEWTAEFPTLVDIRLYHYE